MGSLRNHLFDSQGYYKTELCNKWEETGQCPYGPKCQVTQCPLSNRFVTAKEDRAHPICSSFGFLFRSGAVTNVGGCYAIFPSGLSVPCCDSFLISPSAALVIAALFCVPFALCSFPLIFPCPLYYTFRLLTVSCRCHEA
jgi:hypothetical protein